MKIHRRSFLKTGALLGGAGLFSLSLRPYRLFSAMFSGPADIVSITADDHSENIRQLIDALGGIEKFLSPGDSVGFLLNSPWKTPGNYTHPDVALAAIKVFKDAGAGDIVVYKPVRDNYWEESRYYAELKTLVDEIIYGDERIMVSIPEGVNLREAEVFRAFLDTDRFVNIPVAIKVFKDAGAGDIVVYKPVRDNYWEESRYYAELKTLVDEIIYGDERIMVSIPEGVNLREAEVFRAFLDTDRFVNIPVAKHHSGTRFSGLLKGLMGVSSSTTNRNMHSPEGKYTYGKPIYLSQCIADLALLRKADLCLVDAIECSLDNGPRGPSQTVKPNKLIAGTDPLLLDVYAADLIGFYPEDIATFEKAGENKIGSLDIEKAQILNL